MKGFICVSVGLSLAICATLVYGDPNCSDGRLSTEATRGRCCWPNQKWDQDHARCDGPPNCPSGWTAHGDDFLRVAIPAASSGLVCETDTDCTGTLICNSHQCEKPKLISACSWLGKPDETLTPGSGTNQVVEVLKAIGRSAGIATFLRSLVEMSLMPWRRSMAVHA